MDTVIVAGGAGFIGSNLCSSLLSKNYRVICIDNFITGSKENIEVFIDDPNFSLLEHDVTYPLPDITGEIFAIFHLASPASPNQKSPRSYINYPIETLLVNSIGTYNLLQVARSKKARFLYASSSEIYGDPQISPQKENYFGHVNPNGPRSVYDEGKRFGEAMTMAYVRKYQIDGRIVRIFNTYGEKMQKDDGRVISNFINQALEDKDITVYGDGKQTRSFCYVSDLVDGLLKVIEKDGISGFVFNLGNPDEHTIVEISEIIKKLTNSSSDMVFEDLPQDDPKQRKPDIGLAKDVLGFLPKVGLEKGLLKTIEYFREKI